MGCHAGTGGDPSGDNRVLGFRDPITGTEQIGHVISIVQDSQARLGISMENPFYNRSNVFDSMRVSTWNIPKNREDATSLRSLMGDELTEIPIECSKVQVSRPMYNDQLSSMPMVAQKCIWKLPFRHCDCKAGYRWPRR